MLADEFATVFREEHREIRDTLFSVIEAFRERDRERVRETIGRTAQLTGPHFRYEEEVFSPSLVEVFGEGYIKKLLSDHDRAIAMANALVELAGKEELNEVDARHAIELVREILPHVSDCEGL